MPLRRSQEDLAAPRDDTQPMVKLSHDRDERFINDNFADLFSILVATEHLETAYVRDSIGTEEYASSCTRLIAQYRTAKSALSEHVADVASFMAQFGLQAPAAYTRLEKIGVPATVEHGGKQKVEKAPELYVAACVQHFITSMDSLKLEMFAVDELYPNLSDLMESLSHINSISPDNPIKAKVKEWFLTLNTMQASDEITTSQSRQMLFDLDAAYNMFVRHLEEDK